MNHITTSLVALTTLNALGVNAANNDEVKKRVR